MNDRSDVPRDDRTRWASGTRYAIVPEWILDSPDVSHAGVRLYAILARYANGDGEAFPSRKTLADRMRCSLDTIDRTVAELESAGALQVAKRRRTDGGDTSNLYVLNEANPGSDTAPGAANEGYPPSRTEPAPRTRETSSNESQEELPPIVPRSTAALATVERPPLPANRPVAIGKKRVTDREYGLAVALLAVFNEKFDSNYSGIDWVRKIILRVREHPEIPPDAHAAVVYAVAAGKHWWDGDPTPSVVWGNAGIFERNLHAAARPPDPNRKMTVEELRQHFANVGETVDGDAVEADDG